MGIPKQEEQYWESFTALFKFFKFRNHHREPLLDMATLSIGPTCGYNSRQRKLKLR
jgi:hypothetical protein